MFTTNGEKQIYVKRVKQGEKEDGEVVAVKKLMNMAGMDDKQFLSEVKHLMDVCHPNIVRLEGYCYHIEKALTPYNGSYIFVDEVYRLLCFEYLPNGSLDKHLTGMVIQCANIVVFLYLFFLSMHYLKSSPTTYCGKSNYNGNVGVSM